MANGAPGLPAHLIRAVRYAIDAGDAALGPGLSDLLERACAIGRRRTTPRTSPLKAYEADLKRHLDRVMAPNPIHPAGIKLERMILKVRSQLFVLIQNRDLEALNNASERAPRPCMV